MDSLPPPGLAGRLAAAIALLMMATVWFGLWIPLGVLALVRSAAVRLGLRRPQPVAADLGSRALRVPHG